MPFFLSRPMGRRCLAGLSAALIGLSLLMPASAVRAEGGGWAPLVVRMDTGGGLGDRSALVRRLASSGQRVELRGTCYSACTLYLALANVCVSPSADFGFHGPSFHGRRLTGSEFERWSQMMAQHYREPLRSWFLSTARYRVSDYYRMSGAALIRMGYPSCG